VLTNTQGQWRRTGASCGVAPTLIALSQGPRDHVTSVDVGVPDVLYGANRIRYSMWGSCGGWG